jgi:hypothetical protein
MMGVKPEDCDFGLDYYNYLEASYITNTGKWLNDNL